MPRITIFLGIVLTVAGIGGWLGSGMESWTALIPSIFGIIFIIIGWQANNEKLRKHLIHGALILALLGIIGSVGGVRPFIEYLGGEEIERPLAAGMQSLMTLLCAGYVILGIKSFIDARRNG